MKITTRAATLLLAIASTAAFQAVVAHDLTTDCALEIGAVRTALNDDLVNPGAFCSDGLARHKFGTKICEGLNGKLDDADEKIVQHKIADAASKLQDFADKLYALAFRPKPIVTQDEYASVSAPLVQAQACVGGL